MTSMAFDTLRYARRLREAGVPEPQAEVQAELMAEAFGFYAENLLTRDHFTEVLNARFGELGARLDQRWAELEATFDERHSGLDAKSDKRYFGLDAKIDQRYSELDARIDLLHSGLAHKQNLHTWMLGVVMAVLVLPQLHTWLSPILQA